ncbi:MAG: hypothetical protein DRJ68_02705 [Thermoprotei archaeon]|nr:MAG: hypothetical protein DRJ68_02705 [Thermoprotei archaeon]
MMELKPITTLVGELQAKPGFRFVFEGPAEVCYKCKLKEVCALKLEPHTIYMVVEVLGKKHRCMLREGWVVVARVVEADVEAYIDAKLAVPDAIITYKRPTCKNSKCKHLEICQTPYVKEGVKYRILEVYEEKVLCNGRRLVKVKLIRAPLT